MRLTVENRGNVENSYYEVDCIKNHDVKNQKYIQKIIEELSKRLQGYAVWNDKHTEVSWFTVQMFSFGKPTWDIQPMNMYLYDGLSGMLLIMYEMQKKNKQKFYEYYDTLRNMLWKYTDYMYENLVCTKDNTYTILSLRHHIILYFLHSRYRDSQSGRKSVMER